MGFMGTILRVNLTTRETAYEPLDMERAKAFIGGRGLGISYLLEEVDPTCEPLSPENKLILMTGPLTGTNAPTGSRYMVTTKSPLTNAVTCSNSGGQFGRTLKLTETYLLKPKACFACPIGCGRVTEVPDGPYSGEGEGPEYETTYALGSDCGVGNLAAVTKANYICNEMGMDTITMGATIASAQEFAGYDPRGEKGRPTAETLRALALDQY